MKFLMIIAIALSILSIISAAAGIGAILTMPELREYTNYFWMSAILQLSTGVLVAIVAGRWIKNRPRSLTAVTFVLAFLLANLIDTSHAILSYDDWGYAMGTIVFRILPICFIILAWLMGRGASTGGEGGRQ